jgi:hypothetical protein
MKKRYLLPIFVVAGLASLSWGQAANGEHCKYEGKPAYCQWSTGCYSINNIYDHVGEPCDGADGLIQDCISKASLYTDVDESKFNSKYGEGQSCKDDLSGVWRAGKPEIVGDAFYCLYGTGECWPEQDKDACIAASGSVYKNVPASGEGTGGCAGGTWTGEGKDPSAEKCNAWCKWDSGCTEIAPDDCSGVEGACTPTTTCAEAIENCVAFSPSGTAYSNNACTTTPILPKTSFAGLTVLVNDRSLHISSLKDATVSLFNMQGKQLFSVKVAAGYNVLALKEQKMGVYYAVVQAGSVKQTVKVLLK